MEELMRELLGEVKSIKKTVIAIEQRVGVIEQRLGKLEQRVGAIEQRLDKLEDRIENIEGQSAETNQIVKALLHQSEEQKAQIDALSNTVAHMEGDIKSIRRDLHVVETVTAKNWNDIVLLKAVE